MYRPGIVIYGDVETMVILPLPQDWTVNTKELGWEAHAQSADKELGVLGKGTTKKEALEDLKKKLEGWLGAL